MIKLANENRYLALIGILSVAIPVVVSILMFSPTKLGIESDWIDVLPHLNGLINTTTSVALVAGLIFIKQKKVKYHKTAMLIAFILGSIFLVSYVIYHSSAASTIYGDINGNGILEESEVEQLGEMRMVYLGILISHIILAAIVVPFVLFALYYAITDKISKHRKVVRFAYPIWLYVSVTGVIVYLMISPYY